jgi:REP element-mobilizing transposase RayT
MLQNPYLLDQAGRKIVMEAIERHCAHRGWNLLAAHVRSNHAHAVVQAEALPERIMSEFKSYASRELNQMGGEAPAGNAGRGMEAHAGCGRAKT